MRGLLTRSALRGRFFTQKQHQDAVERMMENGSGSIHLQQTALATNPLLGGSKTGTPTMQVAELRFRNNTPDAHGALPKSLPADKASVDERKLKLGTTIRILRERLPYLLAYPLPQDILSPQITLRLFPSTHPHLPSVSGRIAYTAALWTSPVAWGQMPVVGNVKLDILSERMMGSPRTTSFSLSTDGTSAIGNAEKFIVRWKTCVKHQADVSEQIKKLVSMLGQSKEEDIDNHEFHGLFIFGFDEQARISSHTIEHVEENNDLEKTAKLVSVTDWLLGKAWRKQETPVPQLAMINNQKHPSCNSRVANTTSAVCNLVA